MCTALNLPLSGGGGGALEADAAELRRPMLKMEKIVGYRVVNHGGGGQEWRQRAAEKQGVFQASIGEGALAPSCRAPQGHDQIRGDFQHDIAVEMEEKERLHTLPFPEDPWSLTFLCKHIELIAYRIGSISNW